MIAGQNMKDGRFLRRRWRSERCISCRIGTFFMALCRFGSVEPEVDGQVCLPRHWTTVMLQRAMAPFPNGFLSRGVKRWITG